MPPDNEINAPELAPLRVISLSSLFSPIYGKDIKCSECRSSPNTPEGRLSVQLVHQGWRQAELDFPQPTQNAFRREGKFIDPHACGIMDCRSDGRRVG